uniref:Uncharacterized protein n=1 Tax=Globodera pallida TaxID=36090 RepID=A0A183BLC3_GLOPA
MIRLFSNTMHFNVVDPPLLSERLPPLNLRTIKQSIIGRSSELLRRLEYIHDELLFVIDPPLYRHLNNLQILPQIYGV